MGELFGGRVDKGTLIISKGVVQGDKLAILKSLESSTPRKYGQRPTMFGFCPLTHCFVALALLMLPIFSEKIQNRNIFKNNTKVTFIFFNIALMVLLINPVGQLQFGLIFMVPLCILPCAQSIFDARLGLLPMLYGTFVGFCGQQL